MGCGNTKEAPVNQPPAIVEEKEEATQQAEPVNHDAPDETADNPELPAETWPPERPLEFGVTMLIPTTLSLTSLPGANVTQCGVGREDLYVCVNQKEELFKWDASSKSWNQLPGKGTYIDIGSDGDMWCINSNQDVFHFESGDWKQISGSKATMISVGSANLVCCVNDRGEMYRFTNDWKDCWEHLPGTGSKISVGNDGEMWCVNQGKLFRWVGGEEKSVWESMPGKAADVNVGSRSAVGAISAKGDILCWNGTKDSKGAWTSLGKASKFAVGADGSILSVTASGRVQVHDPTPPLIWRDLPSNGYNSAKKVGCGGQKHVITVDKKGGFRVLKDGEFQELGVQVVSADIGSDGSIWCVSTDGKIMRRDGTDFRQVDGKAKQLAVGNANLIAAVSLDGQVLNWFNESWITLPKPSEDEVSLVSIGHDGQLWCITGNSSIWRWNFTEWEQMPGQATSIYVGCDQAVYCVEADGDIYKWTNEQKIPDDTRGALCALPYWHLVPDVRATAFAVGPDGCVVGVFKKVNKMAVPEPLLKLGQGGEVPCSRLPQAANAVAFTGDAKPNVDSNQQSLEPISDTKQAEEKNDTEVSSSALSDPSSPSPQGRKEVKLDAAPKDTILYPKSNYVAPDTVAPPSSGEKTEVFHLLSGASGALVVPDGNDTGLSPGDIEQVFAAAGTGTSTVAYLKTLQSRGTNFSSMDDLVEKLQEMHNKSLRARALVLEYLTRPRCSLFPNKIWIESDQVNRLFDEAHQGEETIRILRKLEKIGFTYQTFDALIHAVKKSPVFEAQRSRLTSFLLGTDSHRSNIVDKSDQVYLTIQGKSGSTCSLLRDEKEKVAGEDIDELLLSCDLDKALPVLMSYHEKGTKFNSFQDLVDALEQAAPRLSFIHDELASNEVLFWSPFPGSFSSVSAGGSKHVVALTSEGKVFQWLNTDWDLIGQDKVSVDIGSDGSIWACTQDGGLECYDLVNKEWTPQEIKNAKSVSVGDKANVVVLDTTGKIHRYKGSTWQNDIGSAASVSIGDDGRIWCVSGEEGIVKEWIEDMAEEDAKGGNWSDLPAPGSSPATSICAGNAGTVYVVDAEKNIFHWQGNTVEGSAWKTVSTHGNQVTNVSAGSDGIVVGCNGTIAYIDSAEVLTFASLPGSGTTVGCGSESRLLTLNEAAGGEMAVWNKSYEWTQLPSHAISADVGADGELWCVNEREQIFRFDGVEWDQVNGSAKMVAVGGFNQVVVVNKEGHIYKWDKSKWLRLAGIDIDQASIGPDGELWCINKSREIRRWIGGGEGKEWQDYPGRADLVYVGARHHVYILDNSKKEIFNWTGVASSSASIIAANESKAVDNCLPVWKRCYDGSDNSADVPLAAFAAGADGTIFAATQAGNLRFSPPMQQADFIVEAAVGLDQFSSDGKSANDKTAFPPPHTLPGGQAPYEVYSPASRAACQPLKSTNDGQAWIQIEVALDLKLEQLKLSSHSIYVEVQRAVHDEWDTVCRSESLTGHDEAEFSPLTVSHHSLSGNDDDGPVRFRVCALATGAGKFVKPQIVGIATTSCANLTPASAAQPVVLNLMALDSKQVDGASLKVVKWNKSYSVAAAVLKNKVSTLFQSPTDTLAQFILQGSQLPETNGKRKGTDAFFEIFSLDEVNRRWTLCYASETQNRSSKPSFRAVSIPTDALCEENNDKPILVKLWCHGSDVSDSYLGGFVTTVRQFLSRNNRKFRLHLESFPASLAYSALTQSGYQTTTSQNDRADQEQASYAAGALNLSVQVQGVKDGASPYVQLCFFRWGKWVPFAHTAPGLASSSILVDSSVFPDEKEEILVQVCNFNSNGKPELLNSANTSILDLKQVSTENSLTVGLVTIKKSDTRADTKQVDGWVGQNFHNLRLPQPGALMVRAVNVFTSQASLEKDAKANPLFQTRSNDASNVQSYLDFLFEGSITKDPSTRRRLRRKLTTF